MGRTDAHEDACPLLREGKPLIYRFIQEHRDQFPLELMCRVLEVSVSGYFAWRGRPESDRTREDRALTESISSIHRQSRETYGSPRVQVELREQGKHVSRARVTRLMKSAGLKVRRKRKFRTTTNSKHRHPVAENLLERDFTAAAPNQKWCTDITYLPTREGWLYLAVVMDLFSRKVIGWAMRETLHTELVLAALELAEQARQPGEGMLHH
nr:IS3 family transposase [Deinococcus peraridilitoris]